MLTSFAPTQSSGDTKQITYEAEGQRRIHLLEVNDPILLKSITSGEEISFKGQGAQDLILCTSSQTFLIQQLEISNTQLLCSIEDGDANNLMVLNKSSYRLEPKLLIIPNFKPLEEKLEATMFDVPDLVPLEQLLSSFHLYESCQASQTEIDKFLAKSGAKEIDGNFVNFIVGYIRKLAPKYLGRFFEVLMINAALQEKNLKEISIEECRDLMNQCEDEFPASIVEHILKIYTVPIPEGRFILDTKAVCLLFARQILAVQSKIPINEFTSLWSQVCGDFEPEVSLLPGVAILDGFPKNVVSFDHEALPVDIEQRFTMLFIKRNKWLWDELRAYIRPLYEDDKMAETIMVKYCRISTVDNQKFATSRIPLSPF